MTSRDFERFLTSSHLRHKSSQIIRYPLQIRGHKPLNSPQKNQLDIKHIFNHFYLLKIKLLGLALIFRGMHSSGLSSNKELDFLFSHLLLSVLFFDHFSSSLTCFPIHFFLLLLFQFYILFQR